MPLRPSLAVLRRLAVRPFASDRPMPYVLLWSLGLIGAAFCVVYGSAVGFSGF